MRLFWIFSLAFLCGMDGFLIFAPYLIAVVVLGHFLARRKAASTHRRQIILSTQASPITTPAFALAGV